MARGLLWFVRGGLHLAAYVPAFRSLGLEVRVLERSGLDQALASSPPPDAVLDSDLADTAFQRLTSRGIPVVAVMLDHWYSSPRNRPTREHTEASLRLGIPAHRPMFFDVRFRRRAGSASAASDRLYVFTCSPEQVPVYRELEGVRHVEALLFGVDPGHFRPVDLTPEDRARHGARVGFVGSSLLGNPIDGYRLLKEGLDRTDTPEARRLRVLLDELVRLQARDLFRWRVPELIAELERKHGIDFITGGGMTPEKETWAILLGVHVAAIQRVSAVRSLAPLGVSVYGTREWALLDPVQGLEYRGEADWATELPKVIQATEVNLNVSKPMFPSGVGPRILETLACGGFLLSNRLPAVEALFEDGRDLVFYDGLRDLQEKARHYLEHPGERRKIAERGMRKVLEAHTWTHRARRIVEVLERDRVLPL